MITTIYYYTFSNGENPVRQFIDSHPASKPKIMRILHVIEEYGLKSAIPHLKKLKGTPLWEITTAIRRSKELLG